MCWRVTIWCLNNYHSTVAEGAVPFGVHDSKLGKLIIDFDWMLLENGLHGTLLKFLNIGIKKNI